MDVVSQIQGANAGRDPQRLQLKYRAMRGHPFAFLRGTCSLFYARLPVGGLFESSPAVWACGDLHLENFGSFRADNGLTYFDINDFDEAALAPVAWDVVRFLASVRVGAANLGSDAAASQRLCQLFLDAYDAALVGGKARWVERDSASGLIRQLLDSLRERKRPKFLDLRTTLRNGRRVLRTDGSKALPIEAPECARVETFMRHFAAAQSDPAFYEVLDVARRIAGTASLGIERYVVLVRGKCSPDGNYLLDLKRALPSALAAHVKTAQPRWTTQAHRIVGVQQRMQAASVAFLQPVLMEERVFVMSALQPSQDRIALKSASAEQLETVIDTMGRMLAWAQLRSAGRDGSVAADELIDFGGRKKGKKELLDLSADCAAQVQADAAVFNAAFDEGAFAV